MEYHVGFDFYTGSLAIFDKTDKLKGFDISPCVYFFKQVNVELRFNEITSKLNGVYGNLCVYYNADDNEISKDIIKYGLKCGFKKVEIISMLPLSYLNLALQTSFIPVNGDIIWVLGESNYRQVWFKQNDKAKLISNEPWSAPLYLNLPLKNFADERHFCIPRAVFINNEVKNFDIQIIRKISPSCEIFKYETRRNEYNAMLKAQIMANDQNLLLWNVSNVTCKELYVKNGNKEIFTIKSDEELPKTLETILKKTLFKKEIKVKNNLLFTLAKIKIPSDTHYVLFFKIDNNGIFSIEYNKLEQSNNPSGGSEAPGPSIEPTMENVVDNRICFMLPKKIKGNNHLLNIVGIDLGTSRCCAAVNRKDGIETIALDNLGERLLPSYVAYDEARTKCGQIVIDRLKYHAAATVFDSKRIIGRSFYDIQIDKIWPFKIITDRDDKVSIGITAFANEVTTKPEMVAAELLLHIKFKAEEFQGKSLSDVVITIPATFGEQQKEATIAAAKCAGWKTIYLLLEPVAASFAYFINRKIPENSIILLFDLGGGTLDVCIFQVNNNQIIIISNNGDSKLGGRDFDTILIDYFYHLMTNVHKVSMTKHNYKLMRESQKLKENLSILENCSLDIEEFDTAKVGEMIWISRKEFERMTTSLLNRIQNTIYAALYDSQCNADEINKVFIVGVGSQMPMIKNLLFKMFPHAEHCCEQNPDEVVAIGAAYYAYSIFS